MNRSLHCTQLRSIPTSPQTPLPLPVPHPAWPAHRTFLKGLPDPSPETLPSRARANRRWQSSMLPQDRSPRSVPSRIDASSRSHRGDKRGRTVDCKGGRSFCDIIYGIRSDRLSTACQLKHVAPLHLGVVLGDGLLQLEEALTAEAAHTRLAMVLAASRAGRT